MRKRKKRMGSLVEKSLMLFARDVTSLGSFCCSLLILLLLLLLTPRLAVEYAFSLLLVMLLVILIRSVYYKPRPEAQAYTAWWERLDAASFPSMHAARIAVLIPLAIQYSWGLVFLAVLVTLLVAWSRVFLRKHDLVDVTAGILLGLLIGWLTIRLLGWSILFPQPSHNTLLLPLFVPYKVFYKDHEGGVEEDHKVRGRKRFV